jgi:hypothetical protein
MEIPVDGSTTYHQSTAARASDVTAGAIVAVRVTGGQPGSTGTASDITVATP